MKDITVILTSVGGPIASSYINCLKMVEERAVKVIGIDSSAENAGRFLVDEFKQVPLVRDEEAYIESTLQIAARYNADAIVPSSETEGLALAKNRHRLKAIGTKVICSDYEIMKVSSDKFSFCFES